MNTHSLTKNNGLLKRLEFLTTHVSGISTPLQDDSFNQGYSSFTQPAQTFRQLQKIYSLERRCFL
ncbi:MAG: hypothetical protein KME27_13015 [Lyngbya sp. HA4199-MV5]|jgi:hypothetical protein|nr:hypothetical protein [Lyngbya sp. HA4199-MV5]